MEPLTYSSETLITCVSTLLKTSKSNKWTNYYARSYFKLLITQFGDLLSHNGKFYIHHGDEITEIYEAVAKSIMGIDRITAQRCQYVFVNNFENTKEGKYLIEMLKFSRLSAAAQRKVDSILTKYKYWALVDKTIEEILKARDESVVKWCTQNRAYVQAEVK